MREDLVLLGLFALSNALTAFLLRFLGLTVDFWFALFLSLFAVGGNMGFLFLAYRCLDEENSLPCAALVFFIVPGLISLFTSPSWLPPIRLEGIPWDLIAKASIAGAAAVIIWRYPQYIIYAVALLSMLIFAIILSL